MPNWCNNKLTIVGPESELASFVEAARGYGQKYKKQAWEIEEAKRRAAAGIPEPELKLSPFCFHSLVPLADGLEFQPYDPVGYNLEHEAWGVKWGDCDAALAVQETNRLVYTFDTAWSPPKLFLEKLSAKWPELRFALSFGEEYPTRGRLAFHNGLTLFEMCQKPEPENGYPAGLGEDATESDEEERWQETKAWRGAMLDSHDEWAERVLR